MRKNTIKATLTPKPRAKRVRREVENAQFDAFVRRILRAYARRVADGDIEALTALAGLSSEVDATLRLAVGGLRHAPYSYSWSEIADRLGVTPQAAQMRFGKRTSSRHALDDRLLEAGLSVTVATLVRVFADHHPGSPASSVCPGCGYRYPDTVLDCPTNATVRPLLLRRRGEDPAALAQLTPDQRVDLHSRTTARLRAAVRQAGASLPCPARPASLFDLDGKDPAR